MVCFYSLIPSFTYQSHQHLILKHILKDNGKKPTIKALLRGNDSAICYHCIKNEIV